MSNFFSAVACVSPVVAFAQNISSSRTATNVSGGGATNEAQMKNETSGWCQKLKKAFVFHYQYLEDVLETS